MTQPHYIDREAVAPMSAEDRRKADAALADLAFNLASDLSSGHFGMPDAVQMIEGLATRLAALSRPMEAVAWRVKDYADGWILFHNEAPARKSGEARNGALVQALAVIPTEGFGSFSQAKIPTEGQSISNSHIQTGGDDDRP